MKNHFKEPLRKEEELKLIREYNETKAISIRNKIIEHNLKFVAYCVKPFNKSKFDNDDLFQEATIGLIQALENFNPDLNIKFISFGVFYIKDAIYKFLLNNQLIYFPRNNVSSVLKQMDEAIMENIPDDPIVLDHEVTDKIIKKKIDTALSKLTKREKDIIVRFYGIDCERSSLVEISKKVDVIPLRVFQIKEEVIEKLKKDHSLKDLKRYLTLSE